MALPKPNLKLPRFPKRAPRAAKHEGPEEPGAPGKERRFALPKPTLKMPRLGKAAAPEESTRFTLLETRPAAEAPSRRDAPLPELGAPEPASEADADSTIATAPMEPAPPPEASATPEESPEDSAPAIPEPKAEPESAPEPEPAAIEVAEPPPPSAEPVKRRFAFPQRAAKDDAPRKPRSLATFSFGRGKSAEDTPERGEGSVKSAQARFSFGRRKLEAPEPEPEPRESSKAKGVPLKTRFSFGRKAAIGQATKDAQTDVPPEASRKSRFSFGRRKEAPQTAVAPSVTETPPVTRQPALPAPASEPEPAPLEVAVPRHVSPVVAELAAAGMPVAAAVVVAAAPRPPPSRFSTSDYDLIHLRVDRMLADRDARAHQEATRDLDDRVDDVLRAARKP